MYRTRGQLSLQRGLCKKEGTYGGVVEDLVVLCDEGGQGSVGRDFEELGVEVLSLEQVGRLDLERLG